MSIEENAQKAERVIKGQLAELATIISRADREQDYGAGCERLDRWKSRTARLLRHHVSPQEGTRFENKVLTRVVDWDPFESLHDEADEYIAFLQSLLDELENHPEDLLTPSPPVEDARGTFPQEFWSVIHQVIMSVSRQKFSDGHFADAVESALKEINKRVKDYVKAKTGDELDGARLMNRTFSLEKPIIVLDDLQTVSGQDIQKGYMQIFAGSMTGVRNPKAHENITIEAERAVHFLFLCSLLMFKLDGAGVP